MSILVTDTQGTCGSEKLQDYRTCSKITQLLSGRDWTRTYCVCSQVQCPFHSIVSSMK